MPGSGRSPGEGIGYLLQYSWASLVAQMVKNPPAMWETWFQSLVRKIPWKRAWQPTLVFLPGESHGHKRVVGYSSWSRRELDMTEQMKLKLQYFGHLMRRFDSLENWCWEGLGAGGEGDNRGWDGWMASLTRWTWVWVNSGSWWWTGRPSGLLWFMGSQRVGHDWATELTEQLTHMALCKCWDIFFF